MSEALLPTVARPEITRPGGAVVLPAVIVDAGRGGGAVRAGSAAGIRRDSLSPHHGRACARLGSRSMADGGPVRPRGRP